MRLPNASRGFLETAQPAGAPGRKGQGPRPAGYFSLTTKGAAGRRLPNTRTAGGMPFDRLPGVSTACLLIDRATGGPRGFRRTFGQ